MSDSITRAASGALAGRRILVVEDEALVAMLMEDLLAELGCEVIGPAASVAEALRLIQHERPDGAVLDVNLGKEMAYPVADALRQSAIPFVFVTGYGASGLAMAYQGHPSIEKPYRLDLLESRLLEGFSRAVP